MELAAQPRTVIGKKLTALRREGLTPGNVFGKGMASTPVQLSTAVLERVLLHAGTNDVISLKVSAGPGAPAVIHDVILRHVERAPLTRQVLHADFFRVSASTAMEADVRAILVGEPPSVASKTAALVAAQTTFRVSGLPGLLPSSITVDLSEMTALQLRLKDITLPEGITLVSDPEAVFVNLVAVRGVAAPGAAAEAPASP